jgi:alpha-tubulin suppressor-like RCC1 family protein
MSSNTFSSKPSAWFKTKLFSLSLSLFSLIFFSVLLIGCGSSGGGGGGSSSPKSFSNNMTNFSLSSAKIIKSAVISGQNVNIMIDYDHSGNPKPIVTHNGVGYSPKEEIYFSNATMPLHYNITAANGGVKSYYVTIRRAFEVSSEDRLREVISTIDSGPANYKYVTMLITKDLDLSGNERNITDSWKDKNITLEKYNSSSENVTIKGLTIESSGIVGLLGVNVKTNLAIKSFTFDNSIVVKNATINGTHIDITVDYNATNATNSSLTPTVTHTGIDYSPKEAIDFEKLPANYTVTGDGSTKSYSVIVRRGFVVSTAKELANAIDTINSDINSNNYTTILINNDINLAGVTNRTIPSTWKERNIILENSNSTASNVTIKWLTVEGNDTVGLVGVKLERVITAVAAGGSHTLALDSDGKLWASGFGGDGELGLGDYSNKNKFQLVAISTLPSGVRIVSVAAGLAHSLILDSNGKIWSTGYNHYGQLGLGKPNSNQVSFDSVTISGLSPNATIISIAAGKYHSLALDSDGKLWASGNNSAGQLGLDNTVDQNSFQSVTFPNFPSNAKIVSIAAGSSHSLALDSDGKLWASGYNYNGQLGLGNNTDQHSFQNVTIFGLAKNATIVSIAAGEQHSFALDSDGKLWATGANYYGQLGLGDNISRISFQSVTISALSPKIVSIAAGHHHSFALDSNGKLWAVGYNSAGQLGLGHKTNKNSFQSVTIPNLAQNVNITSISAGLYYSLALDSDGELRATGYNNYGQLGLGDKTELNQFIPVESTW